MPAAVTRYDTKKIIAGTPGQLWAAVPVPASGSRITVDANGNPDSPAIHLGMTKEGSTATFELSKTDYYADEFPFPIKTVIEQVNGRLEGSLLQVMDFKVLEYLTTGFGTHTTPAPAGVEELTLGVSPLNYTSVCLIFPTEADPTKFAVLQLYDAVNTGGLSFQVSRKGMAEAAFKFEGRAIGARPKIDCFGNFWAQVGP